MRIPAPLAKSIQSWLLTMTYDCYTADAFTSGLFDFADERTRWQTAVDTLLRLVQCELLWSPPAQEGAPSLTQAEYFAYMRQLAENDPYSGNSAEDLVWNRLDFCLTDAARHLIAQYGLLDANYHQRMADAWHQVAERLDGVAGESSVRERYLEKAALWHKCAAMSRDAGWAEDRDTNTLVIGFVGEIDQLFDKHGVPWSDVPLVPISSAK